MSVIILLWCVGWMPHVLILLGVASVCVMMATVEMDWHAILTKLWLKTFQQMWISVWTAITSVMRIQTVLILRVAIFACAHLDCMCSSGFSGNGTSCNGLWEMSTSYWFISPPSDINECEDFSVTCTSNASCVNTAGSYECVCKGGYSGNGSLCIG